MRSTPRRLALTLVLAALAPVILTPSASTEQQTPAKRAIELQDIIGGKTIGTVAVSNDGQWFAYRIAPGEGDAQIVVRRARGGDEESRFDVGEALAPAAGGGGRGGDPGGGGPTTLAFSENSKWSAFTTHPSRREAQRLRRLRRPIETGVTVVNLATGEKREYHASAGSRSPEMPPPGSRSIVSRRRLRAAAAVAPPKGVEPARN
jgi:hypothetical protein